MGIFDFSKVCGKITGGSVAEWLKAHDSKSCGRASVSEVRILSLPPEAKEESLLSCFVSEGSTEDEYPLASANIKNTPARGVFCGGSAPV